MTDDLRREAMIRTLTLEVEGLQELRRALEGPLGGKAIEAVSLILARPGRLIVTGMGKSGHVGRKIASTLASTGTPAMFVHPAEASHGDLGMITRQDAVLALSWSGEAPELADVIAYARRFDVPLIAISSRPDSALGSAADILLTLPRMPEACPNGLAPTTSTTMQLAMGDALAICLLQARGFSPADFRAFHPGGKLGAQLMRARDLMHGGDEIPSVTMAATLGEAIMEMTSRRFGITGVVDQDGCLAGVLTDGDLRRAFQSRFDLTVPVAEVMTRAPRTTSPQALAAELLGMMNEYSITSVFVVEDDRRPVGILHLHDLLRAGVL
ncbi:MULTISPECIES: KpsF/GutQ family sugar-phosphate isomerase [Roseomonadaceae]|uniref:KpsF/GutQ family sugar-phosphate isomerase n=1 Tax=Falsiroseomonas oleicola TaxID=2801474 RepID=A0ABS6HF56_9PROT|nr:KpsF/GutQ family sugar-phosphate isomerase [Roseomonas oleicola]MBU8547293.1 KpsF/GutQ family sugar-phosphate isomerase [Roseomonas oleicola]